jgi:hypothetical protein
MQRRDDATPCAGKQVSDAALFVTICSSFCPLFIAHRFVSGAVEEEELGFSGGEEEEEDSGEWTEESEDEDQADHRVMLKPVFVPKNKRATIAQREELELEEQRVAEQETLRLAERKEESKASRELFLLPFGFENVSCFPFISHSSQILLAKELAARSAPKTCTAPFASSPPPHTSAHPLLQL